MKRQTPTDPEIAMAQRLEARLVRLVDEVTNASPRVRSLLAPALTNAVARLGRTTQ